MKFISVRVMDGKETKPIVLNVYYIKWLQSIEKGTHIELQDIGHSYLQVQEDLATLLARLHHC